MQKTHFSVFLILLSANLAFSQLVRTGSFVPGSPAYPISGDVTVTFDGNSITIDFENNFFTVQGIDLQVYLGKGKNLNSGTDLLVTTMPLDAGSPMNTPINGPLSFNVPAGTNLYEYDNVIVQCIVANVLWGHANLCESNLDLSSSPLVSDDYRAVQNIESSATLANSSTVTFEAQNMIALDPNFETPASTDFTTFLGPNLGCIIE